MENNRRTNAGEGAENDPIYQKIKKRQIRAAIVGFVMGVIFKIPDVPFVVQSRSPIAYVALLFLPVVLAAGGYFCFEMLYKFHPKRHKF